MLRNRFHLLAAVLVVIALCAGAAWAQDDGNGGGPGKGKGKNKGRGDGGGAGGDVAAADPGGKGPGPKDEAAKDQKKADGMKQELGATDDEWTVLSPKLQKVLSLQRDIKDGGRGGPKGGPKGADGEAPEPTSDLAKATQALATLLANKDASAGDLKAAIQALRDARAKAKTALDQAQKELKELLTVRQEAILLQKGLLD